MISRIRAKKGRWWAARRTLKRRHEPWVKLGSGTKLSADLMEATETMWLKIRKSEGDWISRNCRKLDPVCAPREK